MISFLACLRGVVEGAQGVMFLVSDTQEQTMNTFYEHHKSSIKLAYRCFDRILLNGLIQPFQQPSE